MTRVGEGPFPSEIDGPDQERLRELGGEFGTVTGRERRCGWLDLVALRYAVRVNGITSLALTKLDVLSAFDEMPVCVRYALPDGTETVDFPAHQSRLPPLPRRLRDAARVVAAARRRRAAGSGAARTSSSSSASSVCPSSWSGRAPRASAFCTRALDEVSAFSRRRSSGSLTFTSSAGSTGERGQLQLGDRVTQAQRTLREPAFEDRERGLRERARQRAGVGDGSAQAQLAERRRARERQVDRQEHDRVVRRQPEPGDDAGERRPHGRAVVGDRERQHQLARLADGDALVEGVAEHPPGALCERLAAEAGERLRRAEASARAADQQDARQRVDPPRLGVDVQSPPARPSRRA